MRTDGTTLALAGGILAAVLGHGAMIASVFLLLFVTWWALPIHLICVWFAGNIARNRGRNPNLGHALGVWLGLFGPIIALGLSSREDDEANQSMSLAVVISAIIIGSVAAAAGWWLVFVILGAVGASA
ncbi:MAG: hypothetical protein OXC56_07460 [Chloroflexi bacterium]|nr:hypothetical protein [Chloroflexota bacterium]